MSAAADTERSPFKPKYRLTLWRTPHGTLSATVVPFALFQLSFLLALTTPFSWTGVAVCAVSYAVRMFAITGFYHRYFSHRTFQMGRAVQFAAAWLGCSAFQKGPIWWASHHRQHHKYSDTPEDPHNSQAGFWHCHWLWFLYREGDEISYDSAKDLTRYPELLWLDRHWHLPPLALAFALLAFGGWHWVVWGFFVSTVLVQNGTYCINSLMHYCGRQYFSTGDDSRNHWLLALITLGEGWHNNHHRYQASTRNGFYWWEYDITYYLLKLLSFAGLVRDLNPVPFKILEEGTVNRRLQREARRMGHRVKPITVLRSEIQELSDQLGARARVLHLEVQSLSDHVGGRVHQFHVDMQRLQDQVAARAHHLRIEVHGFGGQVAEGGRQLRLEMARLQQLVNEKGRQVRGEVQALQEQIVDHGRALGAEIHELGELVAARGKTVRVDIQGLSDQVTATAGDLRRDLQEVSEHLAQRLRALREELDQLGGLLPEAV